MAPGMALDPALLAPNPALREMVTANRARAS